MDYREMARIAGDPAAVRAAAKFITTVLGDRLSSWEREFLAKLEAFTGPDPLSMRQRETLYALRSRATRKTVMKGFRASTLIRRLWELRLDLSEEAEEFVTEMHELGADVALSLNQWRYVFALCHEVGEIERYVDVA